jgi:hypothetical protein
MFKKEEAVLVLFRTASLFYEQSQIQFGFLINI